MSMNLGQLLKSSRELSHDNGVRTVSPNSSGYSSYNHNHQHYWDWSTCPQSSSTSTSSSTSASYSVPLSSVLSNVTNRSSNALRSERHPRHQSHHLVVLSEDAIMLDGQVSGIEATARTTASSTSCSSYWGGSGRSSVSKRKQSNDSDYYNSFVDFPVYDCTTRTEGTRDANNEINASFYTGDDEIMAIDNNEHEKVHNNVHNGGKHEKERNHETNCDNGCQENGRDKVVGRVVINRKNYCEESMNTMEAEEYEKVGIAHHRSHRQVRNHNDEDGDDYEEEDEAEEDEDEDDYDDLDDYDISNDNDVDDDSHSHSNNNIADDEMRIETIIDDSNGNENGVDDSTSHLLLCHDSQSLEIPSSEAYPVTSYLSNCYYYGSGKTKLRNGTPYDDNDANATATNSTNNNVHSYYYDHHHHHQDTLSLEVQGYSRPEFVYSQVIMVPSVLTNPSKIGITFAKKRITIPVVFYKKNTSNKTIKTITSMKRINVVVISKIDDDGLFGRRNNYCLKPNDIVIAVNNRAVTSRMKASMVSKMLLLGTTNTIASTESEIDCPPCQTISIMIRNITGDPRMYLSSVEKPTNGSMIGIALTNYCTGNPLVVTRVDHDGLFGQSLLSAGQRCLTINGVPCGTMPSQDAVKLIHRRNLHHHHHHHHHHNRHHHHAHLLHEDKIIVADGDGNNHDDDPQNRNVTILSMIPPKLSFDCATVLSSEAGRAWTTRNDLFHRILSWKRKMMGERSTSSNTTSMNQNGNNNIETNRNAAVLRRRRHRRCRRRPLRRNNDSNPSVTVPTNTTATSNRSSATGNNDTNTNSNNAVAVATLMYTIERR